MYTECTRVTDNGGRTFERYTAYFADGSALLIGPTGNVPNGVCMWVDTGPELGHTADTDPDATIERSALPEPVRRAIDWAEHFDPAA